ncbi:dTDP-4-dehydrorhamnose reductase [Ketogulonicigenium robustum]|uniref:dTDP-4-dehydrorhamnose reductase n=1 Tax=Ketogulonicigenium robustum TaxID=92947 RepID=A0A1W6NZN4_9RHOB|nr:dTDP-4-dehydrorhamnose reductase [Ketogulonicigenium robustum]ARO14467.1 dTDP-4-dehydrorhamnose reductase [Ketogulonicigenium robustum]
MTILVFGRTGQVALELQKLAPDAVFLGRDAADLSDPATCAAAILAHRPSAVINAAAWTAVDKAEAEEATATIINGEAPTAMAAAAAQIGVPFVQISTDYVFDGQGTQAFTPDSPTAPLGAYGRSKLKGEEGTRAAGGVYAILRTSWVFSAHGQNFVKTMRRLGAERASLNVVADQIGGPTSARAIARACLTITAALQQDATKSGTYHFAGAPDVSWADFARAIMAESGLPCTINDIPSSAYPTPAQRPANSRMDCSTLSIFGLARPDWRADLSSTLIELRDFQ